MAVAVTVINKLMNQRTMTVNGSLTLSGNYAAGGDSLVFTGLLPTTKAPYSVTIQGIAGFTYEFNPTTNKLLVRVGTTAANVVLAELADGAYPPAATGDTIRFRAEFPKFG